MLARMCLVGVAFLGLGADKRAGETDLAALVKKLESRSRKVVRDGQGMVVEVSINNLPFADADLELLKPFPGLRVLDLTYTQITDAGVERVVAAHPQLETLSLGGTKATAACVKHLSKLKGLRTLEIYGAAVTDATIRELRAHDLLHVWRAAGRWRGGRASAVSEVQQLHLDNTVVTPAGLKEFVDMKSLTYLYYPKVDDAALRALGEVKMLHTLWLTSEGIDLDARPRSAAEVKSFHLRRPNSVTAVGLKELQAFTDIRRLDLWELQATPEAVKVIGTLKSVEEVSFGSSIGDAGLEELAGLPNLRSLQLPMSGVSDAGLKEIGRIKSLRHLDVANTKVSAAGLKHLAGVPLDHLEVSRAILTDEALQFLRDSKLLHALGNTRNKSKATLDDVIYISLQGAPITDASIPHLLAMKSLKGLDLRGTRVTDQGVADLKKAFPKVQVRR